MKKAIAYLKIHIKCWWLRRTSVIIFEMAFAGETPTPKLMDVCEFWRGIKRVYIGKGKFIPFKQI